MSSTFKTNRLFDSGVLPKFRRVVGIAVVSALLTATTALAGKVQQAGGGTWSWGRNDNRVWSDYLHNSMIHKSSVVNGDGDYVCSGWKQRGVWAKASTGSTGSGNKAYYDTK